MNLERTKKEYLLYSVTLIPLVLSVLILSSLVYSTHQQLLEREQKIAQQQRNIQMWEDRNELQAIQKNLDLIYQHEDRLQTLISKVRKSKYTKAFTLQYDEELLSIEQLVQSAYLKLEFSNKRIGDNHITYQSMHNELEEISQRLNNYQKHKKELELIHHLVTINPNADIRWDDLSAYAINRELSKKEDEMYDQVIYFEEKAKLPKAFRDDLALHPNENNMVYYMIDSYENLEKNHVIQQENNEFLGLTRKFELKDEFNKEDFIRINKNKVQNIPINSEQVELITDHPIQSYSFFTNADETEVVYLSISDTDKFWEQSKYLVIATRDKANFKLAYNN
ncbi:MAG: hypothetical protein HUJ25_09235 [Crocinitomicaceae bacterium]|nr:hypothetical protein [Crocinitomicaceae bacterium]